MTREPDSVRRWLTGRHDRARAWAGRLGLRARATLLFALVAVMVSALAGATVWFSVASYLLGQREGAAVNQALSNAEQVTSMLGGPSASSPEVLARLSGDFASTSLLRTAEDEWFTTDLTVNRGAIPDRLVEEVAGGQPHYQRIEVADRPILVVGLPVGAVGAAYFEVFPLDELDETLHTLSLVLIAGGVVIPLATIALGWWVMRPALRPVERVAEAVAAVARGDVSARIDARGDPSLQSIATSFNATAAALERRVRMDAKFAADVSHELRSPLTTMVNSVQMLDSHRGSLDPEGQEVLDLLRAELDGFERLVQDLLEISRSDAGSQQFALVEFRLAQLVRHALPAALADRLVISSSAETAVVCGDKRRLERVLMNLVDNAERHGGGVTRVRLDATADEVTLVVEDCGPGLRPEELEGIFDRFARGRGSERGSTAGAGLGLALVAQHVRLLGGSVEARNREGGGAAFVVRLPRTGPQETSC